jgi:hypothetical protein
MAENDDDPVSPGEALPPPSEEHSELGGTPGSPVARARSRTHSGNRPALGRMVGTPGAAARRKLAAEREMLRYRLKKAQPQVEALREEQRRAEGGPPVESDPDVGALQAVPVRKKRNPWPMVAGMVVSVIGTIGVAVLCVLFWPAARVAMGNATPVSAAVSNPPAALILETPGPQSARSRLELPADPSAALSMALAELSQALDRARGNPEEVLRKVSKPGQKCTMVWANDSVSLVFGGDPIRANSLAHQLEDCAEAVSRVR